MRVLELAHHVGTETVDRALAGEGDQCHIARLSRLEARGGPGRDVEPHSARLLAIKRERRIGLEEMIVRAYLDRAVAGVGYAERCGLSASVERDLAVLDEHFAGDHADALSTEAPTAVRARETASSNCCSSAALRPRQPATTFCDQSI